MERFLDRSDAGRQLAARLAASPNFSNAVVFGLPRGGVPVAYEVAVALNLPLDVLVVRKIGVPFQREVAMGAIGEDGVVVVEDEVIAATNVSSKEFADVETRERAELGRRIEKFRGKRPPRSLVGRTALIVDDGIATGATSRAACRVARARGAARVVMAAPVASARTVAELRGEADEVVVLVAARGSFSVGQWYEQFDETADAEVVECLRRASSRGSAFAEPGEVLESASRDDEVVIEVDAARLSGHLTVPANAAGVVMFVHGSASSRHSPRNREVAAALNKLGLGTLLFDLLTGAEGSTRSNVFDIELLSARLEGATAWLTAQVKAPFSLGYFGASTGAAAALLVAAKSASSVAAIVARGGRVDLAGARLSAVRAPTLMIVGGADTEVLVLNREALAQLKCAGRLEVIEGATHLFEEPGAMHRVAELAGAWFVTYLAPSVRVG